MTEPHLLPQNLWELRLGDVPTPTNPEAGYASDATDVTTPLGRAVRPGRIVSGSNLPLGSDSGLAQ